MADSRIKSVSELLSSFFDQDLVKKGELYSGFGRSWKTIAGSRLGEHSRPVDIHRGILIVEAEHQGWMQLLQLQQDKIMEEIGRKFPDLKISGMAFKLGDPAKPSVRAGTALATLRREPGQESDREADQEAGPKNETEKEASDAIGGKGSLPPDMVAMFARIRKNIKK